MANYATLKAAIQDVIKTNGNNEITGAILQQSLLAMINSLGAQYQYVGIATPATNPGTPDQNVFYLASTAGTYGNFNSISLASGEVAILKYNGTWTKDVTGIASLGIVEDLTHKIDANNKDYTDVSGLLTNAGFVRTTGAIASGTTYPNSRYTNPIHLYAGDVVYIKANIGATAVSVFTECDSSGNNRKVITPGVSGVSEYRYVATEETYLIISTYNVNNVASGIWLKLTNNTSATLFNKAMSAHGQFEKLGNNIWATNPTGNPANLDNRQTNTEITRRMCYSCIRWAQFTGLDKTIKRTIYILWNGYADYFRVAISKYDTDAAQWVSEFDTNNIPINNINPNHNAVVSVSIGETVKLLIDTSLFGYHTLSTIINPIGTSEPEFIFSDACYKEAIDVNVDGLQITTPRIYPNALLPCVSFEFDDNTANDDLVVNLFDSKGERCNFAFIASQSNIVSLGEKYLNLNRRGYGICSHSVDGTIFNTTNYTRETALAALQTSKNRLQAIGITVNGFVSPSSQMADEFLDLVQMTYGYAFTTTDGFRNRSGNPCRNSRQSMETQTLDYLKERIDIAITFGYNLTFYGHPANFGTGDWSISKLQSLLEYAMAKRDAGQIFLGNSDDCFAYFYGDKPYNFHFTGDCGSIQPKDRHKYYLHDVTAATIAYNANKLADCEILLTTAAGYTSGITFGAGYIFNVTPNIGPSETWHFKIMQGCVIATKMTV